MRFVDGKPTSEYRTWVGIRNRCRNPKAPGYELYGGRGIKVCDRWLESFENFLEDLGTRPPKMSLDRIDVNGDYSPENCRWTDIKTQNRNKRNAVFVTIDGRRFRAIELSDISGLKTDTIIERAARGLSYDEVINPERRWDISGFSLGGKASGAKKLARTHCRNGHEFTQENTYWRSDNTRQCRVCHNAKMRRLQAKWKASPST